VKTHSKATLVVRREKDASGEDMLRMYVHIGTGNYNPSTAGRGLHSFPFQLNLSSSVHRKTQLNSRMCPGVAHKLSF
jgi:hypothetical protein